ncbi:MAG: winged helix-turn-helix domain-containing protein [Acidobacteriota bacterium]|nr:winged helix-turn-helix domain-containing protein [Acidobacteriota bacterium]
MFKNHRSPHPLRLRILHALIDQPRSTKEVALFLDENATKLYRHVRALHQAGLIEHQYDKKIRGTVAHYYLAIAARFELSDSLFESGASTGENSIQTMFRASERELNNALKHDYEDEDLEPLAIKLCIKARPETIKMLRKNMLAWIPTQMGVEDGNHPDAVNYEALLVFYPLGKP